MTYEISKVNQINPLTFVARDQEFCRLTGEGEGKFEYALPNAPLSDQMIASRILRRFKHQPSAYNHTHEAKAGHFINHLENLALE